jgi:signal transduction histidine kinase
MEGALTTSRPRAAPARPPRTLPARVASRLRMAWAQVVLGILAWAVLLIGITSARDLFSPTASRLGLVTTSGGRVVLLNPMSAAARAGIRPGDTVLTVNGIDVRGQGFASLPSVSTTAGLITVRVTSGQAGSDDALYYLPLAGPSATEIGGDWAALTAALTLWVSGLLTGLPRRRAGAMRLYALAVLALALALCALVARDGALFWPWLVLAPAPLVGLAALLGAAVMLARPAPVWRGYGWRPLLGMITLVTALTVFLAILNAYANLPPIAADAPAIVLGLLALAALAAPLILHAGAHDEPSRRRLRVALLAGLLGLAPPLAWPGLTAGAALLGHNLTLFPSTDVSPLWSAVGLIPMAALYSALAHTSPSTTRPAVENARRLDLYARVGLSYVIAGLCCAAPLIALWPLLPVQASIALTVAIVIAFPAVQRATEHLIARGVALPPPNYDEALRRLERLAATTTTLDDLARDVVTGLPDLLQVRGAALLLGDGGDPPGQYRVVTRDSYARDNVAHDATASQSLLGPGTVVRLDDADDLFGASERVVMRRAALPGDAGAPATRARQGGMTLWAPLRWGGSQRGFLALGPRLSGDLFDDDDLHGTANVAGVLTLAFQTLELIDHLRERTDTLVSLTHRLSHAHEQERAHLSRELHDVVAQELIALTRQLRRYGDGRTPSSEIWADMLAAAQDALTHTRRICNGLRPAILDLGLVPALRDLVGDAAERSATTEVSITIDGPEQRFPGEREFALFRVAQEGLTNALEHAQARQVRVEVLFDGAVRLRVRDDGRGFAIPARFEDLPGDHLGLIGMRERLAEFGGALTVASTPGRGTVLEACVPL